MTVRVLLADDHGAIRSGLRMILESDPGIEVVGEAADGAVAIAQARALRPDVVLMDIRMPGTDGIAATREVTARTGAHVLILTSFDVDGYVFAGLRAGASGYLLKTVGAEDLLRAVHTVAEGEGVLAPEVTRSLIDAFAAAPESAGGGGAGRDDGDGGGRDGGAGDDAGGDPAGAGLTVREREVHDCLAEGLSNRQIARRLGIGENTAKTHVARVLRKLDLQSRIQVAIRARSTRSPGE